MKTYLIPMAITLMTLPLGFSPHLNVALMGQTASEAGQPRALKPASANSPAIGRILSEQPNGAAVKLTRAPYIQWTTPTSAHIVWNTDRPSSSVVEYELDLP